MQLFCLSVLFGLQKSRDLLSTLISTASQRDLRGLQAYITLGSRERRKFLQLLRMLGAK